MRSTRPVHTPLWQPSGLGGYALRLFTAYPVFLALNRPSMAWFGDLCYDVALRCSGIAITFGGKHGLTRAEEHFLARNKARFQDGVLLDVGANHGAYARRLYDLAPTARERRREPVAERAETGQGKPPASCRLLSVRQATPAREKRWRVRIRPTLPPAARALADRC